MTLGYHTHMRMQRHAIGLVCLCFFAGAALSAADFWSEKPFLEWSDGNVEKMTTASPWAAIVAVALPPGRPVPSGDAAGGRGGRGGGDEGFAPLPTRIRLTISWRSALPVKQAIVRAQVGRRGTPTPDHNTFLSQAEQFYVIGVGGLPPQYLRGDSTIEAFLRRKDKADIPAQQAGSSQPGPGATMLIGFPRGEIAAADNEVEFAAKIGTLEVKRKFKLADMMFGGNLEL